MRDDGSGWVVCIGWCGACGERVLVDRATMSGRCGCGKVDVEAFFEQIRRSVGAAM